MAETPAEAIKRGEEEVTKAEAEEPEPVGEQEEEEESEENNEDDEPRPVASTMIAEWGYDRSNEELTVTFNNGKTESYPCSPDQWEEAKNTESAGKWMHENVL